MGYLQDWTKGSIELCTQDTRLASYYCCRSSSRLRNALIIQETNELFVFFVPLSFYFCFFPPIVLHLLPLPFNSLMRAFSSTDAIAPIPPTWWWGKHILIPLADFHPVQPPADSPKHQQKIDKNSPGSSNNGAAVGGVGGVAVAASLSGVGSSATLPSQGTTHLPLGSVEAQLKYENDRLKLALAQR